MAQKLVTDTHLINIADAIRLKNNSSSKYTPATMVSAIEAIPTAVPYNWMGSNVECLSSSFYYSVVYAPSTTYANWTTSTTANVTVTPRVPSLYTRCSSTIFATARKPEVDIENTYYTIHAGLYRMDADCCERQRYGSLVDLINA